MWSRSGRSPRADARAERFPRLPRAWRASLSLAALAGAAAAGQEELLEVRGVHDATGEGLARLELAAEPAAPWLGQRVRLTWTVHLERELAEERLVQLFRRPLDVPLQIQPQVPAGLAPLGEPFAPADGAADAPGERASLAFGERIVEARRARSAALAGGEELALAVARAFRAERAGPLVLESSLARFAYASALREDLLRGPVPADRNDAYVRSAPFVLEVREPPAAGRPPGFAGYVGELSVEATAAPRELAAGESLALTLTLRGDGELARLPSPRVAPASGFVQLGLLREEQEGALTLRYDLAPASADADATPPLSFEVFDPGPMPRYRTVRSPSLALSVAPVAAPDDAGLREAAPGEEQPAPAEPTLPRGTAAFAAGALALFALLLLVLRRRGAPEPASAAPPSLGPAVEAFRARLAATPDTDERARAFEELLAARLGTPAEPLSADLPAALRGAGVEPTLARRAAELRDALVAARFGGRPPADAALLALASDLQSAPRGGS